LFSIAISPHPGPSPEEEGGKKIPTTKGNREFLIFIENV